MATSFTRSRPILAALFMACFIAAGCSYPTRNLPAQSISESQGYRPSSQPHTGSTLVIVTISGGGSRATALGLSVLEGLDAVQLQNGGTLAQNIDIVSSVSGGSVAAAYFALKGPSGFAKLKRDFVEKDGIGSILLSGLNPVGLARLSTKGTERIDLLIDYLDKTLFDHATYQSLITRTDGPLLLLNAADMVTETPFSFTQNNFDLICSDLPSLKLSTAVAASAAFPVALSPVTLTDYSHCLVQDGAWPPQWVKSGADTPWEYDPPRASLGRVREAYALGGSAVPVTGYIHLLDGGIADNLGVSEPIDILTRNAPYPGYLNYFGAGTISDIVFVMINARSFKSSTLGQNQATPSLGDMLGGTLNSALDNATTGAAARVRSVLGERFAKQAASFERAGNMQSADRLKSMTSRAHLIQIDFDAIENPSCRQAFHNIPTSWTLKQGHVDALLTVGKALLQASPQFKPALDAVHGHVTTPFPSLDDACMQIAQVK